MKKLPLGALSFARIIDRNLLYADKTRDIYELVKSETRSFFLSRPRRFGKTLLLSALEELFTGHRERFQGLWIDGSDYDFPRVPVLKLSLSLESGSPEIFQAKLINRLKGIAKDAKLGQEIKEDTPAAYFEALIKALSEEANSEIAVLIDEYDAPVTRNLDNQEIATANAKILHDFFATLKEDKVASCVNFTLVTGITRHALTSMDSGPNHLKDISLNPKFAGLCGFTLEEFDYLFADRLETTLASLKNSSQKYSSLTVEGLRKQIFRWYDGYNWGGQTRVLNPFSILNFFDDQKFGAYWVRSGRPAHLTALIKKKPLAFATPTLKTYLVDDVLKSAPELDELEAGPILFHSGYLTVDKIMEVVVDDDDDQEPSYEEAYSFRLPNLEVKNSYYRNCFNLIFGPVSKEDLNAEKEKLIQAFLSRDAQEVRAILRAYFTRGTYFQKPNRENDFHAYLQLLFQFYKFKVQSELPGSKGRLDLSVELPGQVVLVIELKYRPNPKKTLTPKENESLASLAYGLLPKDEIFESLANLASKKLKAKQKNKILFEIDQEGLTIAKQNRLFVQAAQEWLSEADINKTLASLVLEKLPPEIIKKE
ncbi:MAG: AAA family ATPase, partial [Deltaproteobacteria bacterium]|nr:AAA family ATPase [Deltaproteobacteria bacterium]